MGVGRKIRMTQTVLSSLKVEGVCVCGGGGGGRKNHDFPILQPPSPQLMIGPLADPGV